MDEKTILSLANWTPPKEVATRNGPRYLRTAVKTDAFSAAWRSQKELMKSLGASWTKDEQSGEWSLVWWQQIPAEELARRASSIEASRAVSADIDLPHPEGLDYMPFQKAGIRYALDREGVLIGDEMGLGKYLPTRTNILTPTGWRMIGQLKIGDRVIGSNGKSVRVIGVYPQGVKSSYRVTMSDKSSVEAGLEHLWTVRYMRGGKHWEELTLNTQQLLERPKIELNYSNGRNSILDLSKTVLYLPMLTAPVEFDEQEPLPIPPYTLGQMIANAYMCVGTPTITSSIADIEEIRSSMILEDSPLGNSRIRNNVAYTTINNKTCVNVRSLGLNVLSAEKFIPRQYFTATPADRIALLHGLMDGDGSISATHNKVTYHTCSCQLANDVMELVEGIGGIASVRHYVRTDGKPDEYQVRIRLPETIQPFTISRKADRYNPGRLAHPCRTIKSVEYVREVESVCIAVDAPDRLYVTEHCILTHNTIQAIGIINADPEITSAVVICPKSLKLNWYRELNKWLTKPLTVGIADKYWPKSNIVIVNYEGLNKFFPEATSQNWSACIVDEVHYIKNKKSQRSENVKAIAKKSKRNIRMTGTPICNRPVELYNIVCDLHPAWGNYWQYVKRYCNASMNNFGMDTKGNSNLDELQRKLRETVMVRRLKADVLTELPRKIRQIIELESDESSQSVAVLRERDFESRSEERLASLRAAVELSKAESDEAYQAAVIRLKEASSADFTEMARLRHDTAVAKVPAVLVHIKDILDDNDEQKIFVAAHHHDVIDLLFEGLRGYYPVVLTGKTKIEDRQAAVDRFQTDKKCRVFIGSITAAGVGITLTAANMVIFSELDWVPGNITQCEDRCHRIGQTDTVLIQHVVLKDSLDARMANILVSKQSVIDQALDVRHPDKQYPVTQAKENVYQPKLAASTHGVTVDALADMANKITAQQKRAVEIALLVLSGNDVDRAGMRNGEGFNKMDTQIGNQLAGRIGQLTPKQYALGLKLVRKYHAQLPEEVNQALKGDDK